MALQTIAQELMHAADTQQPPRFRVCPLIKLARTEALAIGLDNGNDALKAATLTPDGTLVTIRIPTAFREAEAVQAGRQEVAYRIADGAPFWIGETALAHDGDDLPIGPTRQRLIDARMRSFLAAGVAELLHTAGYAPGEYSVVVGFAIPNTEIVPQRDTDGTERLGVSGETCTALETHLKGATWKIERIDADGTAVMWTIRIITVMPQAQTAGTVLVCTKSATGKTVTDLEGMTVIDIGGGDLQETEVTISPYQLIARRPGDGTIRVARALMEKFPRVSWNAVLAQQSLISRTLMTSGRTRDISGAVEEVIAGPGQALITAILPKLRQSRRFVVITGGGVMLLHDQLVARLALEEKLPGEDYLLINHGLSSLLNAVGAFFGVLFLAQRKG
jgi:hypothetical protein